jgi:hypothetical protein
VAKTQQQHHVSGQARAGNRLFCSEFERLAFREGIRIQLPWILRPWQTKLMFSGARRLEKC